MQTLTVDSGGDASAAVTSMPPGRWGVQFRSGDADAGTLTIKQTWAEVDGDTGIDIEVDDLGNVASYDLSAVSTGGFELAVVEPGGLILAISGGTEDQTVHYSVRRID